MPPAARETPDVNGHHRKGRHPGRHHVETGPGPTRPGGSGRSDHLRHTVSVSLARPLRNSPLRQAGSAAGSSNPAARGAFLHPNPSMAPTGCPQAAIPGGLPPQTTPEPGPSKRGPASGPQRLARSAGVPPNSPASVSFAYGGCRLAHAGGLQGTNRPSPVFVSSMSITSGSLSTCGLVMCQANLYSCW